MILSITAISGGAYFLFTNYWIDISVLEHYNPGRPSIVFDDEGNEWFRFELDRREPVKLSTMPPHLINAFLAAEDWQFFSHCGLSIKGIVRSTIKNISHGRKVQGASTITQQLVKLLYFHPKKTFSRKIKEQLYALIIEQQFTKEQLLEIYLNHIYLGCGIYGVEAAAQRFWGKSVQDLAIDEAASLAAIVKNPAQYCPLLNPISNGERRNVILRTMNKLNFISPQECKDACSKNVVLMEHNQDAGYGPHARELLRMLLEEMVGKQQLYSGGLRIQTTINQHIQRVAQQEFYDQCMRLRDELDKKIDGGLITLEVQTGEIKALVGGADFSQSKYNRAVQARRQMGSIFKPLVFTAAIESGMSFADVDIDEPFELEQPDLSIWAPKNFNDTFNGPITRAYALSHSNNIVTIKTLLDVGVQKVIELAKKCRISGPFYPYPSLALGCIDGTLKEAVGMFNVFANDGVYVEPHMIRWIKDQWGTKIYKQSVEKERVVTSYVNSQVAKVLSLGMQRASKLHDDWVDCEAINKTGTTNESRTSWYIAATPSLTTGIYMGCDDNESLGEDIYPLHTGFPVWLALNRQIEQPIKQFQYDPSLCKVVINEYSGKSCKLHDEDAIEILI
jgi:penicillin-binding protein 1A